ncbi:glycine receptor subunit alphaZ1-like [Saccostrea echinata]|uniref:glycine receptor subunit alphaZ1-like n=1 Tax=Saccostrea echinata TaxID=191078 RepID=UPI002A830F24|nr:glycine receptor subunit alphaZ1-like [Saccostrea echinata]
MEAMKKEFISIWIIFLLVNLVCSQQMKRRDILNTLLNTTEYDPRISPDFERNEATGVNVQLSVISIDSINEISMDFTLNAILRQTWIDPRLNFSHLSNISLLELDQRRMGDVWLPDTFFRNEKSGTLHAITVPNKLLHIHNDGRVRYSIRISLTLSCTMDLRFYPMDDQICSILAESYGYSIENVHLMWEPKNAVIIQSTDDEYTLPQFYQHKPVETIKYSIVNPSNVEFSGLEAKLHLRRNLGYYMSQVFIPSILIVTLSWISFWIHVDAVPARVSLGVICVLTMTTQSAGVRNYLPRVSYIKAIDVWMAFGLVFVFAALLEYAYVNIQTRKHHKQVKKREKKEKKGDISGKENDQDYFMERARRVDRVSRIVFPVSYTLFNIVFWSAYLSK